LADSAFEYVVVTGAGLDTVFQRLADWKTQKGVPAVVRTMEWVYSHYTGRDQAEQLRDYLKTLPDSGVRYVLLGGDVDVVPFRKAFAMNCEWGSHPREDSLPCDLYFADLDGSWDANGNGVYGEVDDSVDLYADIAVGRAPVNDIAQAQTFVRKVLDYEHAAVPDYQNKGLFFAEILWQNPYTDMGVHKNKMEQQSFRAGYSLTKLYQSLGNENLLAVMAAMRENQNFLNHDGHGWIDVMECGGSANRMRTADADTITNAGLGILYSIGCWTTAFDFVSIGEAFVTNSHGGTVATVGNSSYGWGSPGNPGFGYSDKFDNHFWHAITSEGDYRIGDALRAAKEYYAPFSHERNVYRWHQFDVNLMGDPEMPVFTTTPGYIEVEAPSNIGLGRGRYLFTVFGAYIPLPGALVCLQKAGEVYSRGVTDEAGQVWLDADVRTVGQLRLTVTARNSQPVERYVTCDTGALVNYAGWSVSDSGGNGDGIANPGETFRLPTWLRNSGDRTSGPVTATLRTSNSQVTVLDSVGTVGALSPGDSVLLTDAFRVLVDSLTGDNEPIQFDLQLSDGLVFKPLLIIGEPIVFYERHWIRRPQLLPGETRPLEVRVKNYGHGIGHGTWCRLVSLDSFVTVTADSAWYGEVAPLSYGNSADSFVVTASSSCPSEHVARMELQENADDFTWCDTFDLLVGDYGFADDMESGEAKWSHGGTGDLWHRTSFRTHSGSNAWYCGNEGTHRYNSGMDAWLTTVPITVAQNCSLAFWRWFKTPNYGVDGIRVIVIRGAVEDTLDFLGTGGALPKRQTAKDAKNAKVSDRVRDMPRKWGLSRVESDADASRDCPLFSPQVVSQASSESGNTATRSLDHLTTSLLVNEGGWAEEKYDLSWLSLGETIQVKIAFASDGDTVDEGFYIDDVRVTGGGPPVVGIAGVEAAPGPVGGLDAWPSPFRRVVNVRCGGAFAQVRPQLSVYDASGRMVRRLPSVWSTTWDGRSSDGQLVPTGTYFIEARAQSERRLVKVLLAR